VAGAAVDARVLKSFITIPGCKPGDAATVEQAFLALRKSNAGVGGGEER
jgi:hypothetical protein